MASIQTVVSDLARLMPDGALIVIGAASVLMFAGTLFLIPLIVIRLPADYFLRSHARVWMEGRHPVLRYAGLTVKNAAGIALFMAGLAMLVLPGQGVLTMLIGISLLDVPGKRRLERRLLTNPMVFRAMNAMRHRCGKPALAPPASP